MNFTATTVEEERLKQVVQEVRRTRQFDAFPDFLPTLPAELSPDQERILAEIYALALLEEDEETINLMDEHNGGPPIASIAFYYGFHAKEEKDLPRWYKHSLRDNIFYLKGLVSADSLELYLQASSRFDQKTLDRHGHLHQSASAFCSKRMMDHFGYDKKALLFYFRGLCTGNQLEVLEFIAEKVDPVVFEANFKSVFFQSAFLCLNNHLTEVSFPYLLKRGLISVSESEWKYIKDCNDRLYDKLSCDV